MRVFKLFIKWAAIAFWSVLGAFGAFFLYLWWTLNHLHFS